MIGGGVFTTSGFALADHGRWTVLAAWALGGVLAACGALCYGALGRRFPQSGGEYELLRVTVHPLAGFLAGWVSLLVGFTAPIAFAAAAIEGYAVPAFGIGLPAGALGSCAVLAAAAVHLCGVRAAAGVQDAIVLLKLVLIVALIIAGAAVIFGRSAGAGPAPPRDLVLAPFAVTCLWVALAYSGWNAASYVAGEIVAPERSLPRALLLGTLLTTGLYLALNAVFVFAAPVDDLAGELDVALVAADALGGAAFGRVVAAVVVLALLTSISAMMMAGPRVYARMAEDGVFPSRLARDEQHRPAILLQAVLALAMLWTSAFEDLMTYIGWTLSVSSAVTVLGLVRQRRREGAAAVPVPGWPVVPAVFVIATLAIAVGAFLHAPGPAALGLVTILIGAAVHRVLAV